MGQVGWQHKVLAEQGWLEGEDDSRKFWGNRFMVVVGGWCTLLLLKTMEEMWGKQLAWERAGPTFD